MNRRSFIASSLAYLAVPRIPLVTGPSVSQPPVHVMADFEERLSAIAAEAWSDIPLIVEGIHVSVEETVRKDFLLPAFLSACEEVRPGCVKFAVENDTSAVLNCRVTHIHTVDWRALREAASDLARSSLRNSGLETECLDLSGMHGSFYCWCQENGLDIKFDYVDIRIILHPYENELAPGLNLTPLRNPATLNIAQVVNTTAGLIDKQETSEAEDGHLLVLPAITGGGDPVMADSHPDQSLAERPEDDLLFESEPEAAIALGVRV